MLGSPSVAPFNAASYLSKYIVDPYSRDLPKWQRVLAIVLTVALSILTVGAIFVVHLCLRKRQWTPNEPSQTKPNTNFFFTYSHEEISSDDSEDEQELVDQLADSIGEYEGYLPEEQAKVFPAEISEENYPDLAEKLKHYRNKIRRKLHPDKQGDQEEFQEFESLFSTIQNLYERLGWDVVW